MVVSQTAKLNQNIATTVASTRKRKAADPASQTKAEKRVHLTAAEESRRSSETSVMSDDEYFSEGSEGTFQDDSMSDTGKPSCSRQHEIQH